MCFAILSYLGTAPMVSDAQQGSSIAFVDNVCFGGRAATVLGQGFKPGDTVYLELVPPVPRDLPVPSSLPTEAIPQATVTADSDGRFVAQVSFVSPVTGGAFHGSPPGVTKYYALQAYPASFGARSVETLSQAPTAVCAAAPEGATPIAQTVPSALPVAGAGDRTESRSMSVAFVFAGIALTMCLALLVLAWRTEAGS